VSLHQYDGRFFPGTGTLEERGEGPGQNFAINFPFPRYTTDELYLPALEMAMAAIENYQPQAIIVQFGVDGHFLDRMVGLKLSTRVYEAIVQQIHALSHKICEGRLVVVGGGGYEPAVVARCWSLLVANLSGRVSQLGIAYAALHDPLDQMPPLNETAQAKALQMLETARPLFL
jgi:acetoin utilization protein AcuC